MYSVIAFRVVSNSDSYLLHFVPKSVPACLYVFCQGKALAVLYAFLLLG